MAKPDIFIEHKAAQQITACINTQLYEVQWFGRGTYVKDDDRGLYILHEIIVPPQEVTSTFTDNGDGEEAVKSFNFILSEAVRMGLPLNGWGFWGHSHVRMGVTPSQTDWDNLLMFARMWGRSIGGVFNIQGDITGYAAGPHPAFADHQSTIKLDVATEKVSDPDITSQMAEWMKNVKVKTYGSQAYWGSGTGTKGTPSESYAEWMKKHNLGSAKSWFTNCEEVIHDDAEPEVVNLSTPAYDQIVNLDNYEVDAKAALVHYEDAGWKALTEYERLLILPDLEQRVDEAKIPTQYFDAYDYE